MILYARNCGVEELSVGKIIIVTLVEPEVVEKCKAARLKAPLLSTIHQPQSLRSDEQVGLYDITDETIIIKAF